MNMAWASMASRIRCCGSRSELLWWCSSSPAIFTAMYSRFISLPRVSGVWIFDLVANVQRRAGGDLPGLRVGWIACRDTELMKRLVACREHVTITNNALGEHIALEVLRSAQTYIDRAKHRVTHNPGWTEWRPPRAWADSPGLPRPAKR